MEINLKIGKYSDLQYLGGFEKIQFSSIDEAISTFEFLKLGYNSFGKDRTSLMVILHSILTIKEVREDLEKNMKN